MCPIKMELRKFIVIVWVLSTYVLESSGNNNVTKVITSNNTRRNERSEDLEPPIHTLEAELRNAPPKSEILQLLEDDEKLQKGDINLVLSKHPGDSSKMDCSKITTQMFQVLLQNPDTVEPEDYSCGLLNLISHVEKSHSRVRSLESSLHTATTTIKALETTLHAEVAKSQFLTKELNETVHKEMERAIKAENVIARRVLSEKTRVDAIQKNLTDVLDKAMYQVNELEIVIKSLDQEMDSLPMMTQPDIVPAQQMQAQPAAPPPPQAAHVPVISNVEEVVHKLELKISSLQEFINKLADRIDTMEEGSDEGVNKGITQIFKTYASLANEIEKETERATGEEVSLKSYIMTEISNLAKQIQGLQERIAEEKNRAQIIENRRTADLFEEINRAKSEENRIGQKLKEEMGKAASAFKKLEQHVDEQLNVTRGFEDTVRNLTMAETLRALEAEEKLAESINFERTRAVSVENSLKNHLETEVSRAMTVENDLQKLNTEERERAKAAEHELKVAVDVETYRAKGVELSISAQVTSETERAKHEEMLINEHINSNTTRLLTDLIKEFTRAQNAEKELDDKILQEMSRAKAAEHGLLVNINAELSRASEKEQDLFQITKQQDASLQSVTQLRNLIENETTRARNVEQSLETQIQGETQRAKGNEDILLNLLQEESTRAQAVETNFTHTSSEVLRHTRELELEVRKTVMAEVARAVDSENYIKQQLHSEVDRALKAESGLSHYQAANYTDIANRLQQFTLEMERDNMRVEDISLQISRNLTADILTLAELFDDKLDDLERNENIRLKRVEEEMKKCCSSSSWRWRSPKPKSSAGDNMISRIIQVFSSTPDKDDGDGDTTKLTSGSKKSISSTKSSKNKSVESIDDDEEEEASSPKHIIDASANDMKSDIKDQNLSGSSEKIEENNENTKPVPKASSNLRKKPRRTSRRSNSNSKLVSVQSANSKVTSTFG